MKRTVSTLALAAPLAIAALSLGAAPASADQVGPGSDRLASSDIGPVNPHLPPGPGDKIQPLDDPDPDPGPDGPGPDGPDVPDQPDVPDVPDDKTSNPTPCGTPERPSRGPAGGRGRAHARHPGRAGARRRGRGRARRQDHPSADLHRRRCRRNRRGYGARLADGRHRAHHRHRRGVRRPPPDPYRGLTSREDRPHTPLSGGGGDRVSRRPRPGPDASGCRSR